GYEGSSGLFVRGGTPDQNLVLLDNSPIYNSGHLLGFVSLFDGDAIKKMDLHKAYIPAKYGGRLSSVLDIQMKEGNQETLKSDVSIGLIASRAYVSTPIIRNKLSIIGTARASYLSLAGILLKSKYDNNKINEYSNYWMYDANVKLHYKINEKNQWSINQFIGTDHYYMYQRMNNSSLLTQNDWGSKNTSMRFNSILKNNLVFNLYGGLSDYNSQIKGGLLGDALPKTNFLSSISSKSLKAEFDWSLKSHDINFGAEYRYDKLNPGLFTDIDNISFSIYENMEPLSTTSVFVEDHITMSEYIKAKLGVRLNRYLGNGLVDEVKIEPRLELSYYLKNKGVIRVAYNHMNQNVTLLADNGLSFPTDYWIPNGGALPLSSAHHYSIGTAFSIGKLDVEIDAFHKRLSNLAGLRPGKDIFDYTVPTKEIFDLGIEGRVKGLEFSIGSKSPKVNWWLSYTLSKNERKAPNINDGAWYPFNFDRRHVLSLVINYTINKKWECNAAFNYSSGRYFTLPSSYYFDNINAVGNTSDYYNINYQYERYNNARFPSFHRLDIGFSRKYDRSSLTFGLYNVYGRNNPFYVKPVILSVQDKDEVIQPIYEKNGLFGPIPFINFSYKIR
ncbi:MAG: TonB-dependent receptor, partial [Saprospiraceae bacterium]